MIGLDVAAAVTTTLLAAKHTVSSLDTCIENFSSFQVSSLLHTTQTHGFFISYKTTHSNYSPAYPHSVQTPIHEHWQLQ
jgi:hypothetical protein